MSPTAPAEVVTDLADPVMFTDPWPRYAALRRTAPVSRVRSKQLLRGGGGMGYLVTRYDDVLQVHTDPRLSSDLLAHTRAGSFMRFAPRVMRLLTDSMVFKDDPDHKRLRGLVNKAFTPKRVAQMSEHIEKVVHELLDEIGRRDEVDLVTDFATPLPLRVISEMMGVSQADRHDFHQWVERFTEAQADGAVALLRAMPTGRKMMRLFDRLAAERRVDPDDGLITALVRAQEDGDQLDDDEVVAMIFLLLLAGHDTTANLIGSSLVALREHPDQLERLRSEPGIVESAIEELLRFTTPVPCGASRVATEDIEIGGSVVPKGSLVLGMIISANRDETVFDRPDDLDLGRQPNRHLTFAFGAHYCLGNQLARLEARIAIPALFERFPDIRVAVPHDQLAFKPTQSLRGYRHLPVRLR
ncbi:MAG TPA: cytochrome P450 [Microthrixaceae bacterium]|nr:cytochrome P450 [Microthrixaceae bacterium]